MNSNSFVVWLYIFCAFFLSVTALFGGSILILDPSGKLLDIPIDLLSNSPFNNFLIPGIILLTVLGLGSLLVISGILIKTYWASKASILLGFILLAWIFIQIYLLKIFNFLHILYSGLGIILIILSITPKFRKNLTEN